MIFVFRSFMWPWMGVGFAIQNSNKKYDHKRSVKSVVVNVFLHQKA